MTAVFEDAPALPYWIEPELPWSRRVIHVGGHRIHFLDIGSGTPVLLMHGNPMWSYLWRKVIRCLEGESLRLIVPDLLGLGMSDKPRDLATHTLELHCALMGALLRGLKLDTLFLVGQDWGGPIAVGAGIRSGATIRGLVLGNTSVLLPKTFRATPFHRFSRMPLISDLVFRGLGFPLPVLHQVQGDPRSLSRKKKRAYRWPLRKLADRVAPLALARMVPDGPEHPSLPALREIDGWVRAFEGPAALVWGLKDPILGRGLRRHREVLCQASVVETQAGHFLQEEVPEKLALAILEVVGHGGVGDDRR